MKKLLTLILMGLFFIPATYAQKGLQLGVNYMYLSSNIVYQNVWGVGEIYDYKLTNKSSYGIDVGYNFTEKMGIYTGFWMTQSGQDYTDDYDGYNWERQISLNYNIIPVMMRFSNSLNRINFLGGVGVSFAFLSKAEQKWTRDGNDVTIYPEEGDYNIADPDVTDRFESSDIFLNIELGARIFILDELYVDATFFGAYGVKDINAADWQTPNKDGDYNGSHNAFGGIKMGVAYILFGE